jgi:diguanylate cyclase (GGDEF)-like protein
MLNVFVRQLQTCSIPKTTWFQATLYGLNQICRDLRANIYSLGLRSSPIRTPENFGEPPLTQNIELDLADYVVAEIAVVDSTGAVVHCNRKWEETAKTGGLLPKQLGWNYIAECEAAIRRGCDVAEILAGLRAVLQGELPSFVATYACPFNGLHHWFQVLISVVEIKGIRHAILMHVDVSAMQRDALTGLPNRAMFDAQLQLALSLAQETGSRTGIIIVDMNNLKFLNDKHGHHIGDEALKRLALELKNKAGPDCVATRIGGDEFGVVLPVNYDTLFARRVRAYFESGITCSIGPAQHPIFVSASVGFALYPDDGTTSRDLFRSADKSMYAHKRGASVA